MLHPDSPVALARKFSPALRIACWGLVFLGCDEQRSSSSSPKAEKTAAVESASPAPSTRVAPLETPVVEVLQLEESAYGPLLAFEGSELVVVSANGLIRIAPGEAPRKRELPLGTARAWVGDAVVYWSAGHLHRLPSREGAPTQLGAVPLQPQYLAGAGSRVAWLDRDEAGPSRVRALEAGRGRTLYETTNQLVGLTVVGDSVFFVERTGPEGWRIGGVSVDGGAVRFAAEHAGRAPAQLFGGDSLFYYDGPQRSVHALSPDFVVDESRGKGLVCSPLTVVAGEVFCAQVGGIVALAPQGAPRPLVTRQTGHISALAANATHLAWLSDAGENRAVVRVRELR